ncbi:hypothetical protein HDU99_006211 [Rhizoclosmatium hyalinum]|nr:hypothetical protein HDU99_006211 [Rhizoclosmatium hyalinum]
MPNMNKIPTEVYPIMGMIATALTFGTYVVHKELTQDKDIRLGNVHNPDTHWETRLNRATEERRKSFQNVFYQHITEPQ